MTSWITWEIWWSRVWGESEVPQYEEDEHEVAHEPSRLPVEMVQQGLYRIVRSCRDIANPLENSEKRGSYRMCRGRSSSRPLGRQGLCT